MAIKIYEIQLFSSLHIRASGYALIFLVGVRKKGASEYRYQLKSIHQAEVFSTEIILNNFMTAFNKVQADKSFAALGKAPLSKFFINTSALKMLVRRALGKARIGLPIVDMKFYTVRSWMVIESMSKGEIKEATIRLNDAIQQGNLVVSPEYKSDIDRLREQLRDEYDIEKKGLDAMPTLLAAFIQAFGQLPLNWSPSAATARLKKRFV